MEWNECNRVGKFFGDVSGFLRLESGRKFRWGFLFSLFRKGFGFLVK